MTHPERAPFIGRSVPRREDRRLLTGQGRFIADIDLPRMLHAAFVRSSVAHARIRGVDLTRARVAPGVVHALSGVDVARLATRPSEGSLNFPKTQVRHRFDIPVQPLLGIGRPNVHASRRAGVAWRHRCAWSDHRRARRSRADVGALAAPDLGEPQCSAFPSRACSAQNRARRSAREPVTPRRAKSQSIATSEQPSASRTA